MESLPITGHRRALRRMRTVMAGMGTTQQRLDELVRIIAAEMKAEVCSVYVQVGGDYLELYATEGLNSEAVHVTRLAVGEGLVGTIAATADPLNLPDAQGHEKFSYRPETGEEIYSSLLGVPVIRSGRVRGVLVIQNRAQRSYTEDEEEALELISVVIAELIAGDGVAGDRPRLPGDGSMLPDRLSGVTINQGLAVGRAFLHQQNVSIRQMFADDPAVEHRRLRDAMTEMHLALDELLAATRLTTSGEHREVLDSYRSFAEDRGWIRRIREAIDSGLTADAAVQKVREDTAARMRAVTDPYLRERLHDLEDLAGRVMFHLGARSGQEPRDLPADMILVARRMGPAELLDYESSRLRALVLEEGSPGSHVAIIARALDIPVLGNVQNAMKNVDPLDPVIVDGDNGQMFVRPGEEIHAMVADMLSVRAARRTAHAAMRSLESVTRDGEEVTLSLNCGLVSDMQWLDESGAAGVGLFRTEIPFMVRSALPDADTQTAIYRDVLDGAGGRPVVFRTLDIGGDKQLPYFDEVPDPNPMLGWRSIRVGLDRPGMLRLQLRALLRAAAGRDLHVMFPMIAEVAEFIAARRLLDREIARERAAGHDLPRDIRVGTMLEVPGLIWQLDALLPHLDFLSVGSNDLFQFLFAIDRGNPRVSDRYDVLAPGLLRACRTIVERCRAAGVPVSLCGEMAGRPIEAMALIGLGFRSLSMAPAAFGSVKAMVLSVDAREVARYMETLLGAADHSIRGKLLSFARDHGVVLDT